MLDQVNAYVAAAGPGALRAPSETYALSACMVVALMLLDADFESYVVEGTHPASGVTRKGSMADRFTEQVLAGREDQKPWEAADDLSLMSASDRIPVRHRCHPAGLWPVGPLAIVGNAIAADRPAIVFGGWRGAQPALVLEVAHDGWVVFDPSAGRIERRRGRQVRARWVVVATGRRAAR